MARLITYPVDQNVTGTDKLIGTNSGGDETKNYTLNGISNWVDDTGAITIAGQNNFRLQTSNVTGREVRTISLPSYGGNGTPLADITTLVISQQDASGSTINEYLETLVGGRIILVQLDNTSNFAVYFISAFAPRSGEPGFYDATLTVVSSNGNLVLDKSYGMAHYVSGSASEGIWGGITGTITNQTDLVNYIDAEIAVPVNSVAILSPDGTEFLIVVGNTGAIEAIPPTSAAPIITSLPVISGLVSVPATITATAGNVTSLPTFVNTFQWQVSDTGINGWVNIAGATTTSLALTSVYGDKYVRIVQTTTNILGSATANSLSTVAVQPWPQITALKLRLDTFENEAFVDASLTALNNITI
mgnify:FL=1